ncbi:MAG: hypothetical protein ACMXYF_00010 [Candidatus Woesearchaeota archaeon]
MNPILNVRIPESLYENAFSYAKKEGYSNMQDLVKSLLREYALKKKREGLLVLWGSQKGKSLSKKAMRELIKKEFL